MSAGQITRRLRLILAWLNSGYAGVGQRNYLDLYASLEYGSPRDER